MSKILVVDDDFSTRQLVRKVLQKHHYAVITAANGVEACTKAAVERPDLIILDIEMPDQDGFEVVQQIRRFSTVPVLFLSVRSEDIDVVLGLKLGADDYLTKPFSEAVLLARVEAALRRAKKFSSKEAQERVIRIQDVEIDTEACEVRLSGKPIKLTATEYKILKYLAENSGRVLDRDRILDHIWGDGIESFCSRAVDVHIGRLRRKLGDNPESP
ncbi:MAG: response regulator transcription factor [Armatimonadota bacterium]